LWISFIIVYNSNFDQLLIHEKVLYSYGKSKEFLKDSWEGISPFVISSVLWSLYSFLKSPNNYLNSIKIAINVGGDVDTTAAMTGAVSGSFLGIDAIPSRLAIYL